MSRNKRFDIQGLRAWAVIAVVFFHFLPYLNKWGYLGVDIFFVLSGFLISFVLQRKPRALSTYSDFYFKRFKRIFPLALLITLINVFIYSQKDDVKMIKFGTRSALFALLFATNYNVRDEGEDYFEELEQANDYFTHYWSLSVEIQFYALAPFALHILAVNVFVSLSSLFQPSNTYPTRLLTYLSSIALLSFALSFCMKSQDAFSSMLCRLWQFLSGSMAFHLGQQNSDLKPLPQKQEVKEEDEMDIQAAPRSLTLLFIPAATALFGAVLILTFGDFSSLIRLSVTFFAATLLCRQTTNKLLCHDHLQLLGDASYALYLIHWPVVCVLKEWEVDDANYLYLAMAFCVILALIIHLTYEKWYLTLSQTSVFALVGVLYLLCLSMIFHNYTIQSKIVVIGEFNPAESLLRWQPSTRSNDFTEAQVYTMNKLLGSQLASSLTLDNCTARVDTEKNDRFKFCYFPSGQGQLSFLIIGNSYALSPGKLVLKHFKNHYGKISIRAVPHCEPLIKTKHRMCRDVHLAHRKFLEDVERERPDVLFISSRYENPGLPIVGNVTSDQTFLFMLNKIQSYEKIVKKKIFILNSFPQLRSPVETAKIRKSAILPIEGYMPEAIVADDEPMLRRTEELANACEKCVLFNIRGQHLNQKRQFMTVDPISKLWYFESSVHYTSIGLKVIEPVFTNMSREFNRLLSANYPENIFELKH